MMKFETVKAELEKRRENTKYFTKAFYKAYLDSLRATKKNVEAGVDDSYERDGVRYYHSWDAVYNSKFYQKNGGAYCEFLSVVCGAV